MKTVNVCKMSFKNMGLWFDEDHVIFKGIDFNFPCGESIYISSEGGHGKSLLLKLILGLVLPREGEYWINGVEVSRLSFSEFTPYRIAMGYSFDYGGLLSNRTLEQNLLLPLVYHNILSPQERIKRVHEYLEMFDLLDVKDKRPSAVTGGMRKAACVARALILKPQVLLLDEPTAGLKNAPRDALIDYIQREFKTGHVQSIFVTSNDKKFLDTFCTKTLKIFPDHFDLKDYQPFYGNREDIYEAS